MKHLLTFLFKICQLLLVATFGYLIIPIIIGLIGQSYDIYFSLISNPNYAVFGLILGVVLTLVYVKEWHDYHNK